MHYITDHKPTLPHHAIPYDAFKDLTLLSSYSTLSYFTTQRHVILHHAMSYCGVRAFRNLGPSPGCLNRKRFSLPRETLLDLTSGSRCSATSVSSNLGQVRDWSPIPSSRESGRGWPIRRSLCREWTGRNWLPEHTLLCLFQRHPGCQVGQARRHSVRRLEGL